MYIKARQAWRTITSLSLYHYKTIILTILVPAIGPTVMAYFSPDCLLLRIGIYVAAFCVWALFAVLAVAAMLNNDRSEAAQLVTDRVEDLSGQISRLRQEHTDSRVDLRQEIDNLEEVLRSTLHEELGVALRPRGISVRADPVYFNFSIPEPKVTVGGSLMARLRQWSRRVKRRVREVFYGNPDFP